MNKKNVSMTQAYKKMYRRSIKNPRNFWSEQAKKLLSWFSPWENVLRGSFKKHNMRWFIGGKLNACYNCVDRHLEMRTNQVAILWQGDEPENSEAITYGQLYEKVCRFALCKRGRLARNRRQAAGPRQRCRIRVRLELSSCVKVRAPVNSECPET